MADPLRESDPTHIGPYRLQARLGGGGMGQVFLGRSPGGHTVAVKVVRPELAEDTDFRRRFATEVAAARKVGGFYTAQVVDADPDATPPWLATAYIPGPTLHRAVTEHGPLPTESVAVLGSGLAEGLAAVHAQGLVHRDLKPANVLLAQDGPRLIDFGIARALDATSHTHSSTVLGTAAFMSPEQARAQRVGPASDVFSLGCVLAFAATGRSPFGQGPIHAVIFRVVHEGPDLADLPAPLVELVKACLAKKPAARPGLEEALTALVTVSSAQVREDGRWLPHDVTETLVRHTLALTRAETGRESLPERAATGPRRQRHQDTGHGATDTGTGTGTGTTDVDTDTADAGTTDTDQAVLVIGNLSTEPMDVVVDGTALGTVPSATTGTFQVAAGQRSLLVRAGDHGVARRIEARTATTTLAFDIPRRPRSAPEPVEHVVFTGSRLREAGKAGLTVGGIAFGLYAVIMVVMAATGQTPSTSAVESALDAARFGAFMGIVFALVGLLSPPPRLVLAPDELTPPKRSGDQEPFGWDGFEQVSVVGEGSRAQVVVWPRQGRPLETSKALKDYQGGKIVCGAGRIGAAGPRQASRLRAALRWFAGDAWVEQPTAP